MRLEYIFNPSRSNSHPQRNHSNYIIINTTSVYSNTGKAFGKPPEARVRAGDGRRGRVHSSTVHATQSRPAVVCQSLTNASKTLLYSRPSLRLCAALSRKTPRSRHSSGVEDEILTFQAHTQRKSRGSWTLLDLIHRGKVPQRQEMSVAP